MNEIIARPLASENLTLNYIPKDFNISSTNHEPALTLARYLPDSLFFNLKGGYTVETIYKPGDLFLNAGIFEQVCQELKQVVLGAFEKKEKDAEEYAPRHTLTKNAIWVDWLIIARKNGIPIAFSSATFINPKLVYLNSAMVMTEYNTTRIGAVINPLLWKTISDSADAPIRNEIKYICRTHNRNVVSGLMHAFYNVKISTEPTQDIFTTNIFEATVDYLKCNYDKNTGISFNVYPAGLPEGKKRSDLRVNSAFEKVGPCDACYMIGELDIKYVQRTLRGQLAKVEPQLLSLAN